VKSYVGMRKISIKGNRISLNNVPYYPQLVLAQGFYPDGIWTAPSDKSLKNDIKLMMQAGFNGARLHQKSLGNDSITGLISQAFSHGQSPQAGTGC